MIIDGWNGTSVNKSRTRKVRWYGCRTNSLGEQIISYDMFYGDDGDWGKSLLVQYIYPSPYKLIYISFGGIRKDRVMDNYILKNDHGLGVRLPTDDEVKYIVNREINKNATLEMNLWSQEAYNDSSLGDDRVRILLLVADIELEILP